MVRRFAPGSAFRLLFHDYEETALPIDPHTLLPAESVLEAFGITDEVAGRDYYGQIVRTLEDTGAYRRGQPGQAANPGERLYYLFVYDWRRNNVDAARALDRLIEQIRVDFDDRPLKVDIVAHSMIGQRWAAVRRN
jgi:hypothetical protein